MRREVRTEMQRQIWVREHGRTWCDVREALRVGRPQHHHLVQSTGSFEVANVRSDALEMVLFGAGLHAQVNTKHKTRSKRQNPNERVEGEGGTAPEHCPRDRSDLRR